MISMKNTEVEKINQLVKAKDMEFFSHIPLKITKSTYNHGERNESVVYLNN